MEQKELREWEARCIQEEPPACKAGCPLGVDGRAFSVALAAGDMASGRKVLERSMPLPAIVGRLCEAPCQEHCLRAEFGGSITMALLERACLEAAPGRGKFLQLPARPKKVVVLGGGPSSLTVAFELAKKGYPVVLYHFGDRPGGWLHTLVDEILPVRVLEEEILFLQKIGVRFALIEEVTDEVLAGADTVFAGRDDQALAPEMLAGLENPDPQTFATSKKGWFTGGMCPADNSYRFITDISQGREAALSMDRQMQGASLVAARVALRHGKTRLFSNNTNTQSVTAVIPGNGWSYSGEEAVREAGRCLNCQCLECVNNCEYLKNYGGYPKTYARQIYNNSAIVKGTHLANKLINSCSLCRQCEIVCPNDFSMADLCLDARRQMVKEGRMPPSAQWFALEEMRTARELSFLHCEDKGGGSFLFFPGCQLAGIRPEQTMKLYEHLLEIDSTAGIWLDCCGAPAHWGGRDEDYGQLTADLHRLWLEAGRPKIVTACSSCLQMFRDHLPAIPADSVWTLIADHLPAGERRGVGPLAISDPCTARHDHNSREAVRKIVAQLGVAEVPLAKSAELTECCGFGGLMENANPVLARKVTSVRGAQSGENFLTYCAMCRDQLAKTGKPVLHLLDLLFPDTAHAAQEQPQSLSMRRHNRRSINGELRKRFSLDGDMFQVPWQPLKLQMSFELTADMEERRILEDDIRQVLFLETDGKYLFSHGKSAVKLASAVLGDVTFWVEYTLEGETYIINRCWSHRMTIGGVRP